MINGIADDKSLMILNEPSTQAEVCFQQTTLLCFTGTLCYLTQVYHVKRLIDHLKNSFPIMLAQLKAVPMIKDAINLASWVSKASAFLSSFIVSKQGK